LTNYLVDNVPGTDLVGLKIRKPANVQDKVFGISLRHRYKLKPFVVWSVLAKVIQRKARFVLSDRFEVHLDHITMPAGNSKRAEKTKGRPLEVMSTIKKIIVRVKTALNCLAINLLSLWFVIMVTQSTNYIDMTKA